jgi:hypothetical protein
MVFVYEVEEGGGRRLGVYLVGGWGFPSLNVILDTEES